MKQCPSHNNAGTRLVSRFACHSSRSSMLAHTTPACVIPDAQWRLGIAVYHGTKLTVFCMCVVVSAGVWLASGVP